MQVGGMVKRGVSEEKCSYSVRFHMEEMSFAFNSNNAKREMVGFNVLAKDLKSTKL